jgi:hypothetical protein
MFDYAGTALPEQKSVINVEVDYAEWKAGAHSALEP